MKALITGVQGFVGKYLADHLLSQGIEVWGTSREESPLLHLTHGNVKIIKNDLNSEEEILNLLQNSKPDYIFHLAGQSNVKKSWEDKAGTFYANVNKTIFLLDACVRYQKENPNMRLLTVGSSEEYGKVEPHELPIKETTPLRPMSPYGASKAAVSMLIQQYHKAHGLNVVHVRPFNHIGPGQAEGFVVPDFSNQIVRIETGQIEPVIRVGNLSAARDFIDVRDIVDIYTKLMILKKSDELFGSVINVCSGEPREIREILDILAENSEACITIEIDESKLRPIDMPIYFGERSILDRYLPNLDYIKVEETLRDTLKSTRRLKENESD